LQREHNAIGEAIESTIRNIDQRRSFLHAAQLQMKEQSVREADAQAMP
jgi:exonuclease SbcC